MIYGGGRVNYWVNRITHGFPISGVMFRYGYLTVGWSDSNIELLKTSNKGAHQFNELFRRIFPELSNGDSLWRFLMEYEIGDIVVVPFPDEHNNTFSVVKIQGDVEVSKATDITNIGFVRRIKPVKADIPRKILTEKMDKNLFACLKTTYKINDYSNAIQDLLKLWGQQWTIRQTKKEF